jgi:uncharacterized protein
MNIKVEKYFTDIQISVAIIFLVFITINSVHNYAKAQVSEPQNAVPVQANSTLTASGSASANIATDEAVVSLGVENTKPSAEAARTANAVVGAKLIEEITNLTNLPKDQIITTDFHIVPNYNYTQGPTNNIQSYTASTTFSIKTSNIKGIANLIKIATTNGANKVNSITFDISSVKQASEKQILVKNAYTNARNLAVSLASQAGMNITGIKSMVVNSPNYFPMIATPFSAVVGVNSTNSSINSISPGMQKVQISVLVTFFVADIQKR